MSFLVHVLQCIRIAHTWVNSVHVDGKVEVFVHPDYAVLVQAPTNLGNLESLSSSRFSIPTAW